MIRCWVHLLDALQDIPILMIGWAWSWSTLQTCSVLHSLLWPSPSILWIGIWESLMAWKGSRSPFYDCPQQRLPRLNLTRDSMKAHWVNDMLVVCTSKEKWEDLPAFLVDTKNMGHLTCPGMCYDLGSSSFEIIILKLLLLLLFIARNGSKHRVTMIKYSCWNYCFRGSLPLQCTA